MTKTDPKTGEILEEEGHHVRPFAEWLLEQRDGALAIELAEGLNTLVEAVKTLDKAGTLTLKLTVKPAGVGRETLFVIDDVKVAEPQPERGGSIFFADGDSNLSRANPNQAQFPGLREVPNATSTGHPSVAGGSDK